MNYTDYQNIQIAKQEYENYKIGQQVTIDKKRTPIGYVADVIDNKQTGEQTYIITDGNPATQKAKDVQDVTVLYRGSTNSSKMVEVELKLI